MHTPSCKRAPLRLDLRTDEQLCMRPQSPTRTRILSHADRIARSNTHISMSNHFRGRSEMPKPGWRDRELFNLS